MKRIKPKPLDVREPRPGRGIYPKPCKRGLKNIFKVFISSGLPREVVVRALTNVNTYWIGRGGYPPIHLKNLDMDMDWYFDTFRTPEGYDYWHDVTDYIRGSLIELPPLPR